ncbi:MAG: hypothetical protein LBP76_11690 [Treponema sp.]|jgi:hypothetical protein|nr:hypothetical protein [Treponema sp.]
MEMQSSENTGLNFEKVWAMFKETAEMFKETDRKSREEWQEIKRIISDSDKKAKEEFERRTAESERRFQETERLIKESGKELDRKMGELGKKLGSVVEHLMIPNMKNKFRQLGYTFEKSSPNVLIEDRIHKLYAEIDIFLENGDCAMAVEVKTQPNNNDIRDHVKRMEKLRQYADLHQDKRKLYGAVAGAIIPENVKDHGLKEGFYIVEQSGDTVNIVSPPGTAKAW